MAVRDEDLPTIANKSYQHSPKGTSSRMEDLTDSSLQANEAYRSITIGMNGSLKHFNWNRNTLITAIKEFQYTRICDRNSVRVHRHKDVI